MSYAVDVEAAFNRDRRRSVSLRSRRWGAYGELIRNYSSQEYTTFRSTFHAIYSACISESVRTHTRNVTYIRDAANAYAQPGPEICMCIQAAKKTGPIAFRVNGR